MPFAVKNLFDVKGLPTRAGSKINRDLPAATRDATLIERLEAAGAVLVGALNMGEYAYDFTGENIHDGPSRNPHDVTRMTGGSSGGSGAAVGGALVPLTLGSDTNGSIRVPSSFCGIFGLKPTYGRLSRARSFPFVFSFDQSARSRAPPAISRWPMMRCRGRTLAMRPARRGRSSRHSRRSPRVSAICGSRLPAAISRTTSFPRRRGGRACCEGVRRKAHDRNSGSSARPRCGLRHFHLRRGLASPRPAAHAAGRFRSRGARPTDRGRDDPGADGRSRAKIPALVSHAGAGAVQIGRRYPGAGDALRRAETRTGEFHARWRRNAGARQYRHPHPADLLIGLPVVAVPVPLEPMPIGVQIIAAPWREDIALRVAAALEREGVVSRHAPKGI